MTGRQPSARRRPTTHNALRRCSVGPATATALPLTTQVTRAALQALAIDLEALHAAPGGAPSPGFAVAAPEDDAVAAGLALFDRMAAVLDATTLDACAALVVREHPVVRALGALASTPQACLDLFCRAWTAMHPGLSWRWAQTSERFRLTTVGPVMPAARGLLVFSRAMVRHAPTAIGAPPLRPCRLGDDDDGSAALTFALATGVSAAPRIARATDIPFAAVLGAFRSLPATMPPPLVAGPTAARGPLEESASSSPSSSTPPSSSSSSSSSSPPTSREGAYALVAFAQRHGLTAAEQRVLAALDDGLRPADAAARLGLALGTVRVHLKRIYGKTGAHGQRRVLDNLARVRATLLFEGAPCMRSG